MVPATRDTAEASSVHFEATDPDVTFYVRRLNGGDEPEAKLPAFRKVCVAPCTRGLPRGHYQVALGQHDDEPKVVKDILRVDGDAVVLGDYNNRWGLRLAGVVTTVLGPIAAIGIASIGATTSCYTSSYDERKVCDSDAPWVMPGVMLFAGSVAGGIVMMTRHDQVELSVSPGVSQTRPLGASPDVTESLKGLTLSGSF